MILNGRSEIDHYTAQGAWGGVTLDAMFLRTARANPERVALIDPPNRADFTDGAPQVLTYAQAALRVEALAARFAALGLAADDVVAVQLPNTVEACLTLLALMRANLIASPLPPLWRDQDINAALAQVAPRAIVTMTRSDGHAHADMMRYVAAENFSVRHVLVFGEDAPDGTLPIGDALDSQSDAMPPAPRGDGANHIATICFETVGDGAPRPVPRSHNHWIAAAMGHLVAAALTRNDVLLNPFFPTGMTALAGAFAPWLMAGCTLALHQPFEETVFAAALRETKATYTLLPATVLAALAQSDTLAPGGLARIGCVWPAAYLAHAAASAPPAPAGPDLIDIYTFGEIATLAAPRGGALGLGRIPLGAIRAPLGSQSGPLLLETRVKGGAQKADQASGPALTGVLEVRGPMVPAMPIGPADNRLARQRGHDGYVPTTVTCRISGAHPPVADCVGRNQDVLHLGNTAISAGELDRLMRDHSGVADAAVFALPDPLLGERLTAAVTARPGATVTSEDLRTYLMARKVAPHKIPDKAVHVAEIPRDEDGAVARARLAKAT